jgi:hypothetical protein
MKEIRYDEFGIVTQWKIQKIPQIINQIKKIGKRS